MKSQPEATSKTRLPKRQMTAQHRKRLSESQKKLWASGGGISIEIRQKISTSLKKWWATRGSMSSEQGQKISTARAVADGSGQRSEPVNQHPHPGHGGASATDGGV